MKKFAEWLTARPLRGVLAAATGAMLALIALPVAAWLPATVVVLMLLGVGQRAALLAGLGAALPIVWALSPVLGAAGAAIVAVAVLAPAYLAGTLLTASRSLNLAFQVVALAAAGLVVLAHGVLGDPASVLRPLLEAMQPVIEEAARALTAMGVASTAEEIGAATARVAWATAAWMLMLQTMLALFAALWMFGTAREPGLFGTQFRGLRLGGLVAWIAVAALAVNVVAQLAVGEAWQPAEDLLFVLAAAFLLQALAVVHGLRNAQVLGTGPLVLCYVAIVLLPMAMVGLGFADTWVRFRERYGRVEPRPGA